MSTLALVTPRKFLIQLYEPTHKENAMDHYQQFINCIDNLVLEKAIREIDGWFLSFDDLTSYEQGKLIALKIEDSDRDTYELFHEADKSPCKLTNALLLLLKDNSQVVRESYANRVRNHVINYYRKSVQDEIDYRCAHLKAERKHYGEYNE